MDDDHEQLLSRRRLLQTGAVAFAGVTLLGTDAFASTKAYGASARTAPTPPSTLRTGYSRSRFSPHAGTALTLRPPGGAAMAMQLAAVEDVPNVKGLAGDQDAYLLRFRGPVAPPLAEGIATVSHPRFGTLQLYVTPALASGSQQDYLAAINRRIPRDARHVTRRRG